MHDSIPSRCHGADKLARHQRELVGTKDRGEKGAQPAHSTAVTGPLVSERSAASETAYRSCGPPRQPVRSEHATSLSPAVRSQQQLLSIFVLS
ncbi:unnamed protein product [Arctogadus glacialis]